MKTRTNNLTFLFFFLLFAEQSLVSCSSKAQEVEVKEVITLRASQLYNGISVTEFFTQHKGEYEEIAKQYLALAKENKEANPTKTTYYYKRAISLTPKLELYKTLGEHLIAIKEYKEALELYEFIGRQQNISRNEGQNFAYVFGEPDEEMKFNAFKAQLLATPNMTFYNINEYIQENGIDNTLELKVRLLEDKDIKNDSSSYVYKAIAKSFARLEGNDVQQNFTTLLKLIEDTSSSFEITKSTVANFHYPTDSYYWEDEENEEENINNYSLFLQENNNKEKTDWYNVNYNRLVRLPNSIFAIVYSIDTSETACPKEMRHIYHRLVTYAEGGKIIDSKIVASQSGEELTTVSFKAPHFTITEHKRSWKKTYLKVDFDNYLQKTEDLQTKSYSISPTGKIVESSSL